MIDLSDIKLLICDVDGVLSDGRIIYSASGDEMKCFHCRDGAGLKYWQRAGGTVAWITGRTSALVERRAEELGVVVLRSGVTRKRRVFHEVVTELGFTPQETAIIGDDLIDLPMMYDAGFSACPSDAVLDVRNHVNYVASLPGGAGAVREIVEYLLQNSGRWSRVMARYLPDATEDTP